MEYKDYRLGDVFEVEPTNKLKIKGKAYVMDGDIVCAGGKIPYISAISSNNGITGYSNYKPNNSGDCVTLSTTTDSSKTVFYQETPFIGRQQIASVRRRDGKNMGRYAGLYLVSLIRKITTQFDYSNKLTVDYLLNSTISLPVKRQIVPDFKLLAEIGGVLCVI